MDAGQGLQLADEDVALLLVMNREDWTASMSSFTSGKLELPRPHEPAGGLPLPGLDVQAEQPQGLQVVVDTLALRALMPWRSSSWMI